MVAVPDDQQLTHLRSLDAPRLARLLRLRPDATRPPVPADLVQLAERLRASESVEDALCTLPAPALELLQVLQHLGEQADRLAVRQLVALDGPDDESAFERLLDALLDRLLLFATDDGLELIPSLRTAFPSPLGRGSPVADLLAALPPAWTDHVLRTLQVQRPNESSAARAAVARALDPGRVRHLLQVAPPQVLACVEELVRHGGVAADQGGYLAAHIGPGAWMPASRFDYLLDHGLAAYSSQGRVVAGRELLDVVLEPPCAVSLPLHQPAVATVPADDVPVQRESSAAATSTLAQLTELLEELAAHPCPALRTGPGGLGVREVRRLAKQLSCSEHSLGLAARLADLAGLARAMHEVGVAPAYPAWHEQDPPGRLVAILTAWWREPRAVTGEDPGRGKPLPLFVRPDTDPRARTLRQALLRALAALPVGRAFQDTAALVAHVRWAAPLALPPDVGDERTRQVDAALAEMQALGLVAHGRASALGVALAADDVEALTTAASAALPAVADDVLLQADLTAVVTGSPSAALASLLDAMADREARGNASTWRFGPASVRRALDAGFAGDDLLARLAAVARGAVPQPLTYLVRDVARRHGHLAVAPVTCVVVGEDPALLAEVAAHRALRSLAPRLLAPTVLASALPVGESVRALREAGYLPVERDSDGQVVLTGRAALATDSPQPRRGKRTPAARSGAPPVRDLETLAAALLAAPAKATPAKSTAKGAAKNPATGNADVRAALVAEEERAQLRRACGNLSDDDIALLEHAEETGGKIRIEYVDQRRRYSERVVSSCVLLPPYLEAWCHLRQDERAFLLDSIQSVSRVG